FIFYFFCYRAICARHSFPTRRSSDLVEGGVSNGPQGRCYSEDLHFRGENGKIRLSFLSVKACMRPGMNIRKFATITILVFSSFADRKSTRLNSSHLVISYAVFCLKKK